MNAEMLRASIIQKAIEGKLVPQLNEEPAVEQKGEPPEEEPFGIPSKWKWVRLSTIASSNVGLTYKPADLVDDLSGTPVLRSNNIQNGKLNLNELKRVKGTNLLPKNFVLPGDLLMCARNGSKRLVGKSCLIPELKERMMFGAFMTVIRSNFTPYLHIFFSSDAFKKYLGSVNTTTINQITQKNLLNTWIPLPPLDEQNRIVKKIDELLPLVDEYGRDQEQLEKINKDFPIQLEKSLLQEAISGGLVPQLDEEPEVQQIGEAPEEAPFRIPPKWKWVKLSSIASSNVGLTYKPTDLIDDLSGTPVLRSNNIQNGELNLKDLKRVEYTNPSPKNFVQPGDLLMCARNGSKRLVGKCCLIPELKERMMFGAFMAVIRSNFAPYLHIFFSSDAFKKYLGSVNTTTINQITQKNLLNTWIPLPPLEEQNRIVEKFDKLMLEIQKLK